MFEGAAINSETLVNSDAAITATRYVLRSMINPKQKVTLYRLEREPVHQQICN